MADVSGARLLVGVASSGGFAAVAGFVTAYGLPRLAPAWGDTNRLATVIVLEVYLAIIVGHLVAFNGLERLRSTLRIRPTTSRQLLGAFAVCVAAWAAAAVLYLVLSPFSRCRTCVSLCGGSARTVADSRMPTRFLFVLAVGRAALVAPFAEELLFRGSLFGWLRRRLPASAAILVTAALFAMVHPMPVLWPIAFMFGVGAASITRRISDLPARKIRRRRKLCQTSCCYSTFRVLFDHFEREASTSTCMAH